MAINLVNIGAAANDGTGDPLRDAFGKINDNILDLVARVGPDLILGNTTGSLPLNPAGARGAVLSATLTGNVTIAPTNIPSGTVAVYTLVLKQDATGGRAVTFPGSTSFLNGSPAGPNPAANSLSVVTLLTADGGANWLASVVDTRKLQLDPLMWNPGANGDYYWTADAPTSLLLGSVLKRGTGTLAYAKSLSATPTSFSTVTGATTFAAGDTLRITVTSFSGWLALSIPRNVA